MAKKNETSVLPWVIGGTAVATTVGYFALRPKKKKKGTSEADLKKQQAKLVEQEAKLKAKQQEQALKENTGVKSGGTLIMQDMSGNQAEITVADVDPAPNPTPTAGPPTPSMEQLAEGAMATIQGQTQTITQLQQQLNALTNLAQEADVDPVDVFEAALEGSLAQVAEEVGTASGAAVGGMATDLLGGLTNLTSGITDWAGSWFD